MCEWSQHARRLYPPERDPVQVDPAPVWTVRKISPPPAFDLPTNQRAASRYTDSAIRATILLGTVYWKHWDLQQEPAHPHTKPFATAVWHLCLHTTMCLDLVRGKPQWQGLRYRLEILPDIMNTDIESGHTNDVILWHDDNLTRTVCTEVTCRPWKMKIRVNNNLPCPTISLSVTESILKKNKKIRKQERNKA